MVLVSQETMESLSEAARVSTPEEPAFLLTHEDRESRRWEIYWRTKGGHGGGRVFAWEWPERDEDLGRAWGQFAEVERVVTGTFAELLLRREWNRLYS